ncbi:helix-turn-helix domain-containing protein [Streptomyces sp. NPDC127033]|uniref:helix-turn-helix domain-containing protein n=1 Tax=Streptomyces sp. NPDC127033 TaxID=3347110 RepID=UPI003662A32C
MAEPQAFTNASFGSSLRHLRTERGLSLGDLARLVNYSRSHLSRVETGNKRPTEGLARRCDEVLDAQGSLSQLVARPPRRRQRGRISPAQLPRNISDFTGRTDVFGELDRMLAEVDRQQDGQAVVTLVDGAAGVGKTATVVYWGHQVRARFPDGVLFADLQGFGPRGRSSDSRDVLRNFLTVLGATGDSLPDDVQHLAADYRSMLAGKRLLIVLDNAFSAEQVRPLLPASPRCMTVVTSRSRLAGLVAREGAHRVTVPYLTEAECAELLSRIGGLPSVRGNTRCRYPFLPLALRIAVERMDAVGGIELCEQRNPDSILTSLRTVNDETSTMYTVLSWSYHYLQPEVARAFRLLGTRTADPFTVAEAAELLRTDVVHSRKVLDSLVDIHLLEPASPSEYRFEGMVRAFARECVRRHEGPVERAG